MCGSNIDKRKFVFYNLPDETRKMPQVVRPKDIFFAIFPRLCE